MIVIDIVRLFTDELGAELTINQVAKSLKKSYASVNSHVKKLIEQKILNEKKVGSAILCSLNYENAMTIGYLIVASIEKTNLASPTIKKSFPINTDEASCVFVYKNKAYSDVNMKNTIQYSKDSFRSMIKSKGLGAAVIVKGHEQFWEMVKEIVI